MKTPTPYMEDMTFQESSVLSASSELYTAPSPTIFVERCGDDGRDTPRVVEL